MERIKSYRLCEAYSAGALESQVQKLINEGWEPLGPPSFNARAGFNYLQAMVLYKEETPDGEDLCERSIRDLSDDT
jgi:hypothetical protein